MYNNIFTNGNSGSITKILAEQAKQQEADKKKGVEVQIKNREEELKDLKKSSVEHGHMLINLKTLLRQQEAEGEELAKAIQAKTVEINKLSGQEIKMKSTGNSLPNF